jgi:hypothetical protein
MNSTKPAATLKHSFPHKQAKAIRLLEVIQGDIASFSFVMLDIYLWCWIFWGECPANGDWPSIVATS